MPRLARIIAVDYPHHIVQRGNNRQDVSFVADDRRVYLEILKEQFDKYSLELSAYCLMTNHIHLLAIPRKEDSLAKAVGGANFRYTQYINRMHKRSGHLWQGRFYSCALDNAHLLYAMRYIERNPLRAKVCRQAWNYKWSSASAHIVEKKKNDLLDLKSWFKIMGGDDWKKLLMTDLDKSEVMRIRNNTHTGRPLGSDSFLSKLEKRIGRRLRPLPVGRPHKKGVKNR